MKLVFIAAAWTVGLIVGLEMEVYLPALVLFCLAAAVLALLLRGNGFSGWPALLALVDFLGALCRAYDQCIAITALLPSQPN